MKPCGLRGNITVRMGRPQSGFMTAKPITKDPLASHHTHSGHGGMMAVANIADGTIAFCCFIRCGLRLATGLTVLCRASVIRLYVCKKRRGPNDMNLAVKQQKVIVPSAVLTAAIIPLWAFCLRYYRYSTLASLVTRRLHLDVGLRKTLTRPASNRGYPAFFELRSPEMDGASATSEGLVTRLHTCYHLSFRSW